MPKKSIDYGSSRFTQVPINKAQSFSAGLQTSCFVVSFAIQVAASLAVGALRVTVVALAIAKGLVATAGGVAP